MIKFVVVGTQRTGTTLVRTSLDSHSKVRCIGETFKYKTKKGKFYKGELGYPAYIRGSFKKRLMHYFMRIRLINEYLDSLYLLPNYSAVGFKFMYSQAKKYPMVLEYIYNNKIRAIHVVRENVLKTLISRRTAQKRRLFHTKEKVHVEKILLSIDDLEKTLDIISSQNNIWEEILASKVPYIKITYESFLRNNPKEIGRILAFLNLDLEELKSPLVKINPDTLKDIVENYEEIREHLEKSPYKWCLKSDRKILGV